MPLLQTAPDTRLFEAIASFETTVAIFGRRFDALFADWPITPRCRRPLTDDMRQMLDDLGIEPPGFTIEIEDMPWRRTSPR